MTDVLAVSLEPELREAADAVFRAIWLTTEEAVRMFLRQAVLRQELPLTSAAEDFDLPETIRLTPEEAKGLAEIMAHPEPMTDALKEMLNAKEDIPTKFKDLWN